MFSNQTDEPANAGHTYPTTKPNDRSLVSSGQLSQPMLGKLSDKDAPEPTFCQVLCKWPIWTLLIYVWIVVYAIFGPLILAPVLGKAYFDNHGGGGAATYALWYGVFSSIGGLIGFTVQGFLGQMSDMYGRKPLLIFTLTMLTISQGCFNFTDNVWYWFLLIPCAQLTGTFGGISGVILSAFADLVDKKHRTLIYGVLYGTVGIMVSVSSLSVGIIETMFGIRAVMYSFDIAISIAFSWTFFVIGETLPEEIQEKNRREYQFRKQKSRQHILENNIGLCRRCCDCFCEPFKILLRIRENEVTFWLAILSFFTYMPECGLQDMLAAYLIYMLNDEYFDSSKSKEAYFTSLSISLLGVAMLISQTIVLPMLNKCFKDNDLVLFTIGLTLLLLLCTMGVYIYINPDLYVGYITRIIFGFATIIGPITTSSLSKRLSKEEQGLGIGILQAMKGVTYTLSPIMFSVLFTAFKNNGILVTMPFIVSFGFFFLSFPILCFPVRRVLNKYDEDKMRQEKQGNVTPLAAVDAV